jgi:hypothetical protein
VVPERGLLVEALLVFAPLLLFEALFVCAITPPWVSTADG